MKTHKILALVLTAILAVTMLAGCTETGSRTDQRSTLAVGNTLAQNQPTPTDIEYSLERFNLIRRAYWVNGQKEKTFPQLVDEEFKEWSETIKKFYNL